ncbi:MAG: tetratricopeptide repeat protein [Desulfovibrionaceae bacterium]|nr:tetratricopeptide repeat protein [Desulfovibrionaceae bacterium]
MTACNTTVGVGGRTGTTRVGGSVGSTGSVVGIGTGVGSGVAIATYRDLFLNGPSDARKAHRKAMEDLKNGHYDAAAAVFENTLQRYPAHPDATYFLGLTRIYQGRREDGYALLKSYKEPNFFRMTTEVQRTAAYLENKPELSADKIRETMNRNRNDGYNRDLREHREMTTWD